MHSTRYKSVRRAENIEIYFIDCANGRGRRHFATSKPSDNRDDDDGKCGGLCADKTRQDGATKDRDISARLDEAGACEHFVSLKMLGQNRIFYGTEECRMDTHGNQCGQHDRNMRC